MNEVCGKGIGTKESRVLFPIHSSTYARQLFPFIFGIPLPHR